MKNTNKKICIVLIICLIFNIFLGIEVSAEEEQNNETNTDIFADIEAPNLLLGENSNTEKILYSRNIYEKIYPASITKLMTALLTVENCELDDIVTISENAVHSVPSGYVNANLQVGEQLTVEDLLYVMLIPSANDAANALAEHVGGSIESFGTMMNTRAKELGCTGTNFTNPSGLQQEEHYTTTRDLYLIAKAAYSKSIIKKIIGTVSYTLPSTNAYSGDARIFTTTNYMTRKNMSKYYCDYCIGGKTGYTGDAKNCVIEYAQKDGIELIAIVMGENAKVKGQKFLDAKEMFEYAFEKYENKKIASKGEVYESIKINNATKETKELKLLFKEDINILSLKEDKININNLEKSIEYINIKAPIQKGQIIGKISIEYDGIKYETDLIAENEVQESKNFRTILRILLVILIIYIIYNMKKSNTKNKKRKKYGNHGRNIY